MGSWKIIESDDTTEKTVKDYNFPLDSNDDFHSTKRGRSQVDMRAKTAVPRTV